MSARKILPPWTDIAWSSFDRPGRWHEYDDSPMSLDMAQQLRDHPGHLFAQRRDVQARRTVLCHKRSKFWTPRS